MKFILLGLVGLVALGLAVIVLIRWAQRRHLQEVMQSEGLLCQAHDVRTAICFLGAENGKWVNVDLYLSRKRICAFRSVLHQPFIHVPFESSTLEVMFASSFDSEQRSYLGLGAPSKNGEVRFFLKDAREWLCAIEQSNNNCHPETCENFDPEACATCPIAEKQK